MSHAAHTAADLVWMIADMTLRDMRLFFHEFGDEMKRHIAAAEECSRRANFQLDRFCDFNQLVALRPDADAEVAGLRDEFQSALRDVVRGVDAGLYTRNGRASSASPAVTRETMRTVIADLTPQLRRLGQAEGGLRRFLSEPMREAVPRRFVIDLPASPEPDRQSPSNGETES